MKTWLKLLSIGLLSFSIAACSSGNEDAEVPLQKDPVTEQPAPEMPEAQLEKDTGIFVGLMDNQTFEVELNGETKAVRFAEQDRTVIEKISEGSQVELEFYEKENGQLELKAIQAEETKQEEKIEKSVWKFSGIVDTHSVEFMEAGQPLVAQYSPELKSAIENLAKDEEIEVHYKKDEFGRLVLVKVEKVNKK